VYNEQRMARSKAATKRTTIEKGADFVALGLRFDERILAIMKEEAAWAAMPSVAKFARRLIINFVATSTLERAAAAPVRTPLSPARDPRLKVTNFRLPRTESKILFEICNRLGGASKSTVLSHLVLDWCGISPLSAGFAFETRPPKATTSTVTVTSKLAEDVLRLLEAEAALLGMGGSELLRQIINGVMGLSTIRRSPSAPAVKPLRNGVHRKAEGSVRWSPQHAEFITGVCRMLGGGERATVLSHFILDWIGISPLRDKSIIRSGNEIV
jgi:hypothetical protein